MKKLTAGILASLIGLVSANSADAAVASKAYVDGAIETLDAAKVGTDAVTSFVKTVSETDGKISATAGDLKDVIISGTNVTVTPNGNGQLVIDGHAADGNTQYNVGDTTTINMTLSDPDENGNFTITADGLYEGGNGVTVDGKVISANVGAGTNVTIDTAADGKLTINAKDTTYTFGDTTTVDMKAETAADGSITVTAAGLYQGGTNVTIDGNVINANFDDGVAGTLDGYNEGDTGLQVLTRSCTGEGEARTCTYMWESIDRDYNPAQLDVPHDE